MWSDFFFISKIQVQRPDKERHQTLSILDLTWHFQGFIVPVINELLIGKVTVHKVSDRRVPVNNLFQKESHIIQIIIIMPHRFSKIDQVRGGVKIEKQENLGHVPIRVDPPPPSDLWDIFEFGTFLKNVDPPLLPNWDIFEFQRFFIKAILQK